MVKVNFDFTRRHLSYVFGLIVILGIGFVIAQIPNPGHSYSSIESCPDGTPMLKSVAGVWTCSNTADLQGPAGPQGPTGPAGGSGPPGATGSPGTCTDAQCQGGSDGIGINSISGVYNEGGDVDLVAGSGIIITPSDSLNKVTFTASGGPAGDVVCSGCVHGSDIASNTITGSDIAAGAIGTGELEEDSVDNDKIRVFSYQTDVCTDAVNDGNAVYCTIGAVKTWLNACANNPNMGCYSHCGLGYATFEVGSCNVYKANGGLWKIEAYADAAGQYAASCRARCF